MEERKKSSDTNEENEENCSGQCDQIERFFLGSILSPNSSKTLDFCQEISKILINNFFG
jgi:dephospho-CoA kinase